MSDTPATVLQDGIERLQRAEASLDQLIEEAVETAAQCGIDTSHNETRLRGKREGVQLAISYASEDLRRHRG